MSLSFPTVRPNRKYLLLESFFLNPSCNEPHRCLVPSLDLERGFRPIFRRLEGSRCRRVWATYRYIHKGVDRCAGKGLADGPSYSERMLEYLRPSASPAAGIFDWRANAISEGFQGERLFDPSASTFGNMYPSRGAQPIELVTSANSCTARTRHNLWQPRSRRTTTASNELIHPASSKMEVENEALASG